MPCLCFPRERVADLTWAQMAPAPKTPDSRVSLRRLEAVCGPDGRVYKRDAGRTHGAPLSALFPFPHPVWLGGRCWSRVFFNILVVNLSEPSQIPALELEGMSIHWKG